MAMESPLRRIFRALPLLTLCLALLTACASTPPAAKPARTAGEMTASAAVEGAGQANLKVTADQATVELGGQRFTAPNPRPGFTEVGLQVVPSSKGAHLLASVTDPQGVHGWVLVPGANGFSVALEAEAGQSLTVMSDLVIAANRVPTEGGGFTVSSRIYRYNVASGRYEASRSPTTFPSVPGAPAGDGHDHSSDPNASEVSNMSRLERTIYLVAGSLLAAACLLLLFRSNQALRQRAEAEVALQVQLSKSQAQVLALEEEMADVKGQLLAARAGQAVGQATLTTADMALLRAAGLQEPVAGLVASLENRTDLLPAGAQFAEPKRWTITRNWVIARYTGEHENGWLLLRYKAGGGAVEWSLLEGLAD